jgi:hypothetical protein
MTAVYGSVSQAPRALLLLSAVLALYSLTYRGKLLGLLSK